MPADLAFYFEDSFEAHPELLASYERADVQAIVSAFAQVYDANDAKDVWFNKMKEIGARYGFAADMKAYKANPSAFKGNVSDVAKILRVLVTGREQSPDLYAIMRVLGAQKVFDRLKG